MKNDVRLGAVVLLLSLGIITPPAMAFHLPENPVGGSSVFVEKKCLRCHAILGYGGTVGPDLGQIRLGGGFLGMAGVMWNHAPKMIAALARDKIPLPRFTTKEMTQLVAFLYALNYLDPPGDARRGEEIFATKRCIACHSVGGEGGTVGPPLDKFGNYISPIFVATALWNKGPAMADVMRKERIPRPTLSGRDVQDIVAFIRARARRSTGKSSRIFVQPGNPKLGASLFVSKGCAGCHSPNAGKPRSGPLLSGRKLKVNLSTISSRMWNHAPHMWPMWKEKGLKPISLTVEEMANLTAYLYFLQFETPPGDPARGVHLFIDHQCAACHIPGAEGKFKGPDLRTKGPWRSDIDLAREMWNHAGKMYGTFLKTSREWPKLGEREVADLLAYIRSIGGTKKKKEEGH